MHELPIYCADVGSIKQGNFGWAREEIPVGGNERHRGATEIVELVDALTSNPESKQAEALIHESFPPAPTASEIVIVRSDRYTVDDPAFKAKVLAVSERGAALAVVADAAATTPPTMTRSSPRIATQRWFRS